MVDKTQVFNFTANTLIYRQDDRPTQVYFVKTGRLKVLRKVDFRVPQKTKQASDVDYLVGDPTI